MQQRSDAIRFLFIYTIGFFYLLSFFILSAKWKVKTKSIEIKWAWTLQYLITMYRAWCVSERLYICTFEFNLSHIFFFSLCFILWIKKKRKKRVNHHHLLLHTITHSFWIQNWIKFSQKMIWLRENFYGFFPFYPVEWGVDDLSRFTCQ